MKRTIMQEMTIVVPFTEIEDYAELGSAEAVRDLIHDAICNHEMHDKLRALGVTWNPSAPLKIWFEDAPDEAWQV